MKPSLLSLLVLALFACNTGNQHQSTDTAQTIMDAEKAFEKMAAEKGIGEAFWHYADSNAVIKRGNDSLIIGKEGIRNFYKGDFYKSAKVTWTPDFIDLSQSGDMAYTYGKYKWTWKDSTGREGIATGIFHTVWKKQADGSWKYVWD